MYESYCDYHKPVFSSNSHSKFTHIAQSNIDSFMSTTFRWKHIKLYDSLNNNKKKNWYDQDIDIVRL